MYKAIKDGETLTLIGSPNYIRQKGYNLVLCQEAEAQGVAIDSIPYALFGREPMTHERVQGEVVLVWVDDGAVLSEQDAAVRDADEMNVDQEYRLTLLELGLTDV